eukprot:scaffold468850_cov22-Prasinocladus_malaysianus.AAC.1
MTWATKPHEIRLLYTGIEDCMVSSIVTDIIALNTFNKYCQLQIWPLRPVAISDRHLSIGIFSCKPLASQIVVISTSKRNEMTASFHGIH